MDYLKRYTKVIVLLFASLIVLTPFFAGGRNFFIQNYILIIAGIIFLIFLFIQKKEFKIILPDIFLVCFLIFSLISSLFSTSIYKSLVAFSFLVAYFLIYIIFSRLELNKKYKNLLLNIIISISSILCLFGLWLFVFGSYARLTSFFYWPNPFASYLLLVTPLSFYLLIKSENKFKKYIYLSSIILFFSSFILTGSRGAFIALILGSVLALIIFKSNINKTIIKPALVIIIFSILLSIGLNILKTNTYESSYWNKERVSFSDGSTNIRLGYWKGAWDIFQNNKLTGSGLNTFGIIYPSVQKNPVNAGLYAHNFYLEILSEGGIFVFIAFIAFILSILFIGFKKSKENNLTSFLLIACFSFLIHIGVDISWSYPANLIIFWLFLGLICSQCSKQTSLNKTFINILKIILTILSLVLIIEGSLLFMAYSHFQKGINFKNTGEYFLAEENFQKSVNLSFGNPSYTKELIIIQYTIGLNNNNYLNKAFANINSAIKKDYYNSANYELLGRINLVLNNHEEAKNNFEKAIKLDKNNHPSYYGGLAESYIGLKDLDRAKITITNALGYFTKDIIKNREINIMRDQKLKSGFGIEIEYLNELLNSIQNINIK